MIKFPITMSFRLTLWYAFTFISLFTLGFFILYVSVGRLLDNRIDDDLEEDMIELKMLFDRQGMADLQQEIDREKQSANGDEFFIQVLASDGREIYTSDLGPWEDLSIDTSVLESMGASSAQWHLRTLNIESLEHKTRVIYGALNEDYLLYIGESTEEKNEIMARLLSLFVAMFVIVLPFASVIGWLIARKAMKGVNEINRAVLEIKKGKLDPRVPVIKRQDEIQILATNFNAMAGRISALIQEMREMIDNIAHDLRSPIGRIRAISESALSGSYSESDHKNAAISTLEECEQLIQLINTSLDLAEAESGLVNSVAEDIDLSNLVEDACELFDPLADERSILLSCSLDKNCKVKGNRSYLQRMVANLIDNALKYTPSSGKVSVTTRWRNQHVDIIIADSGIGISRADQGRVFERFFRCDTSRGKSGCGLGLNFAQAVARAHGGDILLRSAPREGTMMTVSLPVVASFT